MFTLFFPIALHSQKQFLYPMSAVLQVYVGFISKVLSNQPLLLWIVLSAFGEMEQKELGPLIVDWVSSQEIKMLTLMLFLIKIQLISQPLTIQVQLYFGKEKTVNSFSTNALTVILTQLIVLNGTILVIISSVFPRIKLPE